MQIEVRYSCQGVVFQQDLSAREIELTDTELATIYGGQAGAGQPVVQQQIQQQVVPPTTPSQQQQTTADPVPLPLPLPQEVNHTINLVGGRDLSLN